MNREFVEGERERGREEGAYSRSPQDRVTPGQPIQKKSLQMKTIGRGVRRFRELESDYEEYPEKNTEKNRRGYLRAY